MASEIFPHYSLIFRRSNSIYPEVPWTYSNGICHKACEVNNEHFNGVLPKKISFISDCCSRFLQNRALPAWRSERDVLALRSERRLKVFSACFLRRYESPSREYKDRWPKPQRKASKANNHQWRATLSRTAAPLLSRVSLLEDLFQDFLFSQKKCNTKQ